MQLKFSKFAVLLAQAVPESCSQTFTKSSLLLCRPRAFGGIAPPKSSSGDQNWFPLHNKAKYLVKYAVYVFLTIQVNKIERKLRDGGGLLKIFQFLKIFVVHEILVRPRCIMESDNGSLSLTIKLRGRVSSNKESCR